MKNRRAAPASLPCVPLFGSAIFPRPGEVFARRRRSAPLQVLLSAVECFQKDYCKRKETAFLESCRRSGSPPGRRSYRPRNRALSNSPLGCWLPRLRRGRAVQVLLSAVECFQKDYCKRKTTAFLESCRRSGSPPGRHSYRPRNRGLTKAPLGLWLRHKCRRPVQVLLSAGSKFPKGLLQKKRDSLFGKLSLKCG